jgi:hypothetical protein
VLIETNKSRYLIFLNYSFVLFSSSYEKENGVLFVSISTGIVLFVFDIITHPMACFIEPHINSDLMSAIWGGYDVKRGYHRTKGHVVI